jgi:hypothetical protein
LIRLWAAGGKMCLSAAWQYLELSLEVPLVYKCDRSL